MIFAAFASLAALPAFREVSLSAGQDPEAVAAADFNRDGKPDLIIGNSEPGTVTVLLNNGGGRLHAAPDSPVAAGQSACSRFFSRKRSMERFASARSRYSLANRHPPRSSTPNPASAASQALQSPSTSPKSVANSFRDAAAKRPHSSKGLATAGPPASSAEHTVRIL
jgi:hypothetical protein